MPTLIKRADDGRFAEREDEYATLGEADPVPAEGGVILPLARAAGEAAELKLSARKVGALVTVDDDLDQLVALLPELSVVALQFAKFRDGRSYSTAALLRGRHGFKGELRAVGDVLIEAAPQLIRCGFDAFAPADDSPSQAWQAKAALFRHVYQSAPDQKVAAYAEREEGRAREATA